MPGRVCVPHLQRVLLAVAREARFLGRQQVHFFVQVRHRVGQTAGLFEGFFELLLEVRARLCRASFPGLGFFFTAKV
jgi:hypothetical protein